MGVERRQGGAWPRSGRTILELGGNNALIVSPSADLDMAAQAIFFGAVGTAGQRCTSHAADHRPRIRRATNCASKLLRAYKSMRIGDPLDAATLMGPLIDRTRWTTMQESHRESEAQRRRDHVRRRATRPARNSPAVAYMRPAIAPHAHDVAIVQQETFAPLLYLMTYRRFRRGDRDHNEVPQGLTSAIFTNDMREAERFLCARGSDCGIANVNIGTSGAEIGGAFGGEKETGGGRESGSDSWKMYMRRQTNTINYSTELPLAQGITFGDDAGSATA